jgi:phenylalanyl-tRNA synthetase beta chain
MERLFDEFRLDPAASQAYHEDQPFGVVRWEREGKVWAEVGLIPAEPMEPLDFQEPVWYATFDVATLFRLREDRPKFQPLPEFPTSRRDLSLLVGRGVTYRQILETIRRHGGKWLESVRLFDLYEGEGVPEGYRAYGVRLVFRSSERTLRDEEVAEVVDRILARLRSEWGVQVRSS